MTQHTLGRSAFAAFALVSAVAGVRSFEPQVRPGSEPITLDILALSADGRPVRDLKPEDLTVKMDGKTRMVRSLQFVPIGDAPGSGERVKLELPPPFSTNVSVRTGRAIVFVIDDESLRAGEERRTKDAITQLLTELPATDQLALITVPHGGIKVDFTTDREKFRQGLAPIVGQAPQVALTGQEAACQTRFVLEALVSTLKNIDPTGGPTTFAVLTTGLVGPRSDQLTRARPASAAGAAGSGTIGRCELTSDMFQHVADAAATAHAQFYLVQAEHIMNTGSTQSTAMFGGDDNPAVGLENLAGVTGGQILRLTTANENVLARIARETSAHYLVSFDVDPQDRTGSSHRLDIRSARADVTVHARPSLLIARPDAAKATVKVAPKDTLRDVNAYRELPLRAAAFSSRNGADDKIKIVASIEPIDPAVSLTTVVAGLFDGQRLVAQWSSKPEDLLGKPTLAALAVPPGTYRLRAAASDAAGRVGVVDVPITAELTSAGSLKLSSLVLGVQKAGGAFTPGLEFSSEAAVLVGFELYGGKTNMQIGATVEVAESVAGPAIQTAKVQWAATSEPDRFQGMSQVQLASLAPGDYIVRAIVGIEGEPEGRVIRTLRKR
jgi:VWFA-related protein